MVALLLRMEQINEIFVVGEDAADNATRVLKGTFTFDGAAPVLAEANLAVMLSGTSLTATYTNGDDAIKSLAYVVYHTTAGAPANYEVITDIVINSGAHSRSTC